MKPEPTEHLPAGNRRTTSTDTDTDILPPSIQLSKADGAIS